MLSGKAIKLKFVLSEEINREATLCFKAREKDALLLLNVCTKGYNIYIHKGIANDYRRF